MHTMHTLAKRWKLPARAAAILADLMVIYNRGAVSTEDQETTTWSHDTILAAEANPYFLSTRVKALRVYDEWCKARFDVVAEVAAGTLDVGAATAQMEEFGLAMMEQYASLATSAPGVTNGGRA